MALKIFNTLTKQKEIFTPLKEGRVGIYVCGPTVYDHPHIGHAKSYISFDVVVRYLRYLGYKVRYVQNITDVGHLTDNADSGEDKIEKRAKLEEVEPMELVEMYMRSYYDDMDRLNNLRPDISPRATGHIPEQIDLVKALIDKGFAYEANQSVYFDVSKFAEYGKLSGRKLEEQEMGARIDINPEKRHPADFALWKRAETGHIMKWNSPWGAGFPGWHLECSVMSMRYLGDTLDIHGGGIENVFPHHECEIAQSEAANSLPFARYWMHNNMVTVDGQKMGKSLGNFVTLKDAFKKFSPITVRFFVLNTHYRSPINYSDEALEGAETGRERLQNTIRNVRKRLISSEGSEGEDVWKAKLEKYKGDFEETMNEDFNTAGALAVLFNVTREVNHLLNSVEKASKGVLSEIDSFYRVYGGDILGIVPDQSLQIEEKEKDFELEDSLIKALAETRNELRESKQWELSDKIRDRLSELGIVIEDRKDEVVWRKR
ncbi:MAG: cysteine--tRNA ligase [Candidatus Scalindua sp. AMX11]|nr:MAG: cysteine--tRNA ligase [Candidatus Scalindua sp.]NOG84620.1 cysteine--tRNA ligase [Planctomycetota bacterium]RZV92394.1 MAG: cysteine--tRNA ligase [Candidatus Scalindua sp. SCAELEC01]TDE66081.1 MAG: cysteine--tRNA ligase [Candidatus Scalindua sp. AMX11]GJQ59055.1 MAG: cysteine--tRNA ligase [Candidatus Scalindua sp.]